MRWTTSARKPRTPRRIQKRSTSSCASRSAGVVPVHVGLLGQEVVQVVLAGRLVERPRRFVERSAASSCSAGRRRVRGRATRTSRGAGPRVSCAPRGTSGAGRTCGWGRSRATPGCRVRPRRRSARRGPRASRTPGRRRSGRRRRSRSPPSASGRAGRTTRRRCRATRGGRARRACRRGRRPRHRRRPGTSAGRPGR
jgi:hypothetical protein